MKIFNIFSCMQRYFIAAIFLSIITVYADNNDLKNIKTSDDIIAHLAKTFPELNNSKNQKLRDLKVILDSVTDCNGLLNCDEISSSTAIEYIIKKCFDDDHDDAMKEIIAALKMLLADLKKQWVEKNTCAVCYEYKNQRCNLVCDHTICYECAFGWVVQYKENDKNKPHYACPICRKAFSIGLINAICSDANFKQKRDQVEKEQAEENSQAAQERENLAAAQALLQQQRLEQEASDEAYARQLQILFIAELQAMTNRADQDHNDNENNANDDGDGDGGGDASPGRSVNDDTHPEEGSHYEHVEETPDDFSSDYNADNYDNSGDTSPAPSLDNNVQQEDAPEDFFPEESANDNNQWNNSPLLIIPVISSQPRNHISEESFERAAPEPAFLDQYGSWFANSNNVVPEEGEGSPQGSEQSVVSAQNDDADQTDEEPASLSADSSGDETSGSGNEN